MSKLSGILVKTLAALAALTGAVFTAAFVMILWSDPEFTAPLDLSPEVMARLDKASAVDMGFFNNFVADTRVAGLLSGGTTVAR